MDTVSAVAQQVHTLPMIEDVLRIDLLAKLLLATVLGSVIGFERESSGKPAGLRTNILICVGAALFTEYSYAIAHLLPAGDPSRIAAQIVSGMGFLGAGTIMQAKGNVTGLTTAATLWVVAAIGMAVGAGGYIEATGTTLLVLVILWPLGWVEDRIEGQRRGRVFRVVLADVTGCVDEIQQRMEDVGLVVKLESVAKAREGELQATFDVRGNSNAFRKAREEIMEMHDVKGVFRG